MTTPQIKLTNVHKRFGKKVVLDGVDLDINKGDSIVIIGGSGTGSATPDTDPAELRPADPRVRPPRRRVTAACD